MKRKENKRIGLIGLLLILLSSCSVSRHLPNGGYLVEDVKIIVDNEKVSPGALKISLRQQPNTRLFGLVRWPLGIYCLSGKQDNFINRFIQGLGEEPRVFDENLTPFDEFSIQQSLINQGYLRAQVDSEVKYKKRRAYVTYYANPREMYYVRNIQYQSNDADLLEVVYTDTVNSLMHVGMPFDANVLDKERDRMTEYLHNNGYYAFNKDYITFLADTMRNSRDVNLKVRVRSGKVKVSEDGEKMTIDKARRYRLNNVYYLINDGAYSMTAKAPVYTDTLMRYDQTFCYNDELAFRPSLLTNHSFLYTDDYYSARRVKETYRSLGRLNALKYTNINFTETSDSTLDCRVSLFPTKKIVTGFEVDLTNTAGDFGVSAALTFTNRNLFHGAEVFSLKLRGAYENITHLKDYAGNHYIEYGADMGLNFPTFIMPFVSSNFQRHSMATTQFELQFNAQKRPEFDRNVLSASWSYLWNTKRRIQQRYDLLGINYVSVPHKDQYFIDNYLDKYNSKNSIMKFNYEDLLIFRMGYLFNYSSMPIDKRPDYFRMSQSVRAGVECAGNLLHLASMAFHARKDTLGHYRIANIAYAQYVKGDFAWTVNMNFNSRNALLFHVDAGVAYPYGNARMLPFEKRYYAGGANSVRGWTVRGLGPGSYVPRDGTIDYINQSGDIKLDMSLEYRNHLFWKLNGALFVDAGNIWTIYKYDDQPDGLFTWNKFYKQIAVSYGLGLRLDLNFLVLRLDAAMKAVNPAYMHGPKRYPIAHPNFRRDFAWHFAVGYPF